MKLPETLEEKILFAKVVYFPLCDDYLPGITKGEAFGPNPATLFRSFCEALTMKVPEYDTEASSFRGTPWFIVAAYILNSPDSEWIDYGYGTSRILKKLIYSIREGRPYVPPFGDRGTANTPELIRQYQAEAKLIKFLS